MRSLVGSGVQLNLSLNIEAQEQEFERIFGQGAGQEQLALEYQAGNNNDVEDIGNESGQDRNTSSSSEETGDKVVDDLNMSEASGMKTTTPTREPRG